MDMIWIKRNIKNVLFFLFVGYFCNMNWEKVEYKFEDFREFRGYYGKFY